MFTGELAESRQTEVVIRDIDERAMELLIDFAYTSQVNQFITQKKNTKEQMEEVTLSDDWQALFTWSMNVKCNLILSLITI